MMNYIFLCISSYFLIVEATKELDAIIEENPKRTFPARRAIDGTRGRAFYVPEESDAFDIYRDAGQYSHYADTTDFADIRSNVPGEPGVDYPSYMTIPQTSFQCQGDFRGYYADEEAGCQLFHVCDSNFLVSSFLCPIGSIFSQKLLTCNWWNKVDCSATRNFHIANSASLVTQADDDEILRKAYEMTSLQTSHNSIINTKDRTIQRAGHVINDLQTGPNHYNDYSDDLPDVQYKYSSRYSSSNHRDREIDYHPMIALENQQNPKIKVHTIGQDHKNDNDDRYNDFRPSYAPTVPTVTTTTRRFYSPTVPTTSPRSISRRKYDLEFESSDHLYSARGRTIVSSTTEATKPTIDTTTSVVVEVPPILEDITKSRLNQIPKKSYKNITEKPEVITERADIVTQFSTIEFQSLFSGKNNTYGIDANSKNSVEMPSADITPPFLYYSNVNQHEAIQNDKSNERNSTLSNNFLITVQSEDIKNKNNDAENEVIGLTAKNSPLLIKIQKEIPLPSKLFLPPLRNSDKENFTSHDNHESEIGVIPESHRDSSEEERTPFHVSLSLGSSTQHGAVDIKPTEVSQSELSSDLQTPGDSDMAGSRPRAVNIAAHSGHLKNKEIGSISGLRSADQYPRPFSLEPQREIEIITQTTPFANANQEAASEFNDEHELKDEIIQQDAQTFGRITFKSEAPLIFDLPHVSRNIDFKTGKNLEDAKEMAAEDAEYEKEERGIETELVPSIGFSLNSASEREEYAEAVLSGLFTDIPITNLNKGTDNSES